MNYYEKWIKELEEKGFLTHADIKTVHKFDWGLEYLGLEANAPNPYEAISKFSEHYINNSSDFFIPPKLNVGSFKMDGDILTFPSSINTSLGNNNIVKMQYYPVENKKFVIIVVPHWNAPVATYDKICLMLQKINLPCLRMTLPFHDTRGNGEKESSTLMVSANIGSTIQAMQQSVRDILSSIDWLESQGFSKIGILGSSIGSCSGFMAACHDKRVTGFFANHMSSYFGDVVWTGRSTVHIRKSFDTYNEQCNEKSKITQEMIKMVWMLNSPIAFVDKIKLFNPGLKQFIVSGKYDTTFPPELTQQIIEAFKQSKVNFTYKILPCGHYSLGKYWFKYIDGFYLFRFFKGIFRDK